jgi:hypothetical protein
MDRKAQHKAKQRLERINTFRLEQAQLEQEHVLTLTTEQTTSLNVHYDRLIADLTTQFDLDVTESGKRISWGMRITSLLGGAALCAALVLFLHRIWGTLPTTAHSLILLVIPLLFLATAEVLSSFGIDWFYTTLLVLASAVGFVMEMNASGSIFNMVPSVHTFLVWGSFIMLLAYAYGNRLMLGAGLFLLCAYTASMLYSFSGGYGVDFIERPESILPASIIVYVIPWVAYRNDQNDFGVIYRLCGAAAAFSAILILAIEGHTYSERIPVRTIETIYQFAGLIVSGAVVFHGIRLGRSGLVNLGTGAFIIFLYIKLYTWWWAWMPKYLFFLLIGLIALLLLYLFQRLHAGLSERSRL